MHNNGLLDHDSLKSVNEMCNAALFALACIKQNNEEWWVRNPLSGEHTPDAYLMKFDPKDDGKNRVIKEYGLEIVTYEKHSPENVVDFLIRTKLNSNKQYSENSAILCRIDKDIHIKDWREIHSKLIPHMGALNVHFICRTQISPTRFKAIWMGNNVSLFVEGADYILDEAIQYEALDVVTMERRTGVNVEPTGYTNLKLFTE